MTDTVPSPGSIGGYRDLVVQLTGSSEDEARLALAEAVATTFGTHIIGVHLHVLAGRSFTWPPG